jgi:phage shock protein PspC (stress-responsive transcriptional regulator)
METEATDTQATGSSPDETSGTTATPGGAEATPGGTETRSEARAESGAWFTTTTDAPAPSVRPGQRLHRAGRGRMLGGVALGLADYFDIDPTLVRIGFVALAFLGGLTVPLYLAGWLLIPDEDTDLSVAEEFMARDRSRAY